jgi:hypothetical protein
VVAGVAVGVSSGGLIVGVPGGSPVGVSGSASVGAAAAVSVGVAFSGFPPEVVPAPGSEGPGVALVVGVAVALLVGVAVALPRQLVLRYQTLDPLTGSVLLLLL